ncbi:MAG: hypothetical protein KKB13_11020 [Chloroflexi bacterium]|nr:hypothetical protein [Chloroflexota bacterium]MBU1880267.1 hypothetical protein [Chloroflexota bacterium]
MSDNPSTWPLWSAHDAETDNVGLCFYALEALSDELHAAGRRDPEDLHREYLALKRGDRSCPLAIRCVRYRQALEQGKPPRYGAPLQLALVADIGGPALGTEHRLLTCTQCNHEFPTETRYRLETGCKHYTRIRVRLGPGTARTAARWRSYGATTSTMPCPHCNHPITLFPSA